MHIPYTTTKVKQNFNRGEQTIFLFYEQIHLFFTSILFILYNIKMCNNFIFCGIFLDSHQRVLRHFLLLCTKGAKGAVNALYTRALRQNLLVKVFQVPPPCD